MVLGRILYHLFYRPVAFCRTILTTGIPYYFLLERCRREMRNRAFQLKEVHRDGLPDYTVYFLTGKKYWYQTSFCLYSLQRTLRDIQVNAVFIDDGTLDQKLIIQIKTQFPHSTIKANAAINLETWLPPAKYPLIHQKRKTYPHLRKLTDVHAGQTGWKLVLDSDMLFFKFPGEMSNWLKNPEQPYFLKDPVCSYYYPSELMEELAGNTIIPFLNVGAVGLQSEMIDWDQLERWIGLLEQREGSSYFLEQALSAMLAAGKKIEVADENKYMVMPDQMESREPTAVLHHYVASSKQWYFLHAWRLIL